MKRPNKFGAKAIEIDGHRFPSRKEGRRYCVLKQLERAGLISNLRLQVPYKLVVNGVLVSEYVADFVYDNAEAKDIVEDVKGHRTREYLMKRKLMKACHGITILET